MDVVTLHDTLRISRRLRGSIPCMNETASLNAPQLCVVRSRTTLSEMLKLDARTKPAIRTNPTLPHASASATFPAATVNDDCHM